MPLLKPLTALLAALLAGWSASTIAQPQATQPTTPANSGAVPEPIPIEDFARLPFLTDALLSPDGTRIAARVSEGGEKRIGIWTLSEGPEQTPRLIPASGGESFEWASDRRLLIQVTRLTIVVAGQTIMPVPTRRVGVVDLDANKVTPVGPSGSITQEVIFIDPHGRYILLSTLESIRETPGVVRVDLATGDTVEVQPPRRGVWSWFADDEGVVRVGVDYGERRTRIYYRPEAQAELRLVESRRNLADDSVIDAVRFTSNTNRGFVVTNSETGRFAVYDYDFATDTLGPVRFAHAEVDVIRAIFARNGNIDGVIYEDDRLRVHWMNPQMADIQALVDRTFPGHVNQIVNQSRDGNRVLIFSYAADDPGTYYVLDRAARRMEIFASPHPELVGRRLAPVRAVEYRSPDGLTIPAYLTLPPGRPERGLPLIVLPHGGPFLRDSWAFNSDVQFLASRGYAVLQPNFRGSTGYGREFVERGYGQFGTGMIDDIDAGVDWLVSQGIVDGSRVCIMGASYGGYAAVWGAIRSPQRYRCAVSLAGMSDLRAMLRYDARQLVARRYFREWRRRVRGEERIDLDAVSPLRHAERLRVPLLIAHGEQDTNVPVDHARRMVRALREEGIEVESVFYPKSGHGFTDAAESADYMRRVEAFLTRHNPADMGSSAEAPP